MNSSTTNASVELIPGMDKLLEYMKNQDKKIKELQEENKKLNFQVDALDKQATDFCLQNGKLKEENKKLEEESLEMEYCNGVCCERSPKHGRSWWKSYGFRSSCKCAYTIMRQEENKKLEEEIKKLKEVITKNYQKQINMTLMGVEPATEKEQDKKLTKFKEEVKEIIQTETLPSVVLNRFYKAFEEEEESEEEEQ